ncbi:GNAT family N-acetyltransferase [Streptosporangium sandarakinum]|uniref:GNAT family N-acetyltransferase n=1 Tax=Streptosporangium sandarakinum TaxID=1260955 RepID=UPI0033A2683A
MNAEVIATPRLTLLPLAVEHAAEMAEALDDPALHEFTGGSPATAGELRDRYARMVAGPPDGGDAWLNWVVRVTETGRLAGYVQATVTPGRAWVAWVVGTPWQGRGLAAEAATAMVAWLREHGVRSFAAAIHPGHAASAAVARHAGLTPTPATVDGEIIWESPRPSIMGGRRLDGV